MRVTYTAAFILTISAWVLAEDSDPNPISSLTMLSSSVQSSQPGPSGDASTDDNSLSHLLDDDRDSGPVSKPAESSKDGPTSTKTSSSSANSSSASLSASPSDGKITSAVDGAKTSSVATTSTIRSTAPSSAPVEQPTTTSSHAPTNTELAAMHQPTGSPELCSRGVLMRTLRNVGCGKAISDKRMLALADLWLALAALEQEEDSEASAIGEVTTTSKAATSVASGANLSGFSSIVTSSKT